MNAIRGDEPVLVIGSGLTAVDTVLSLTEHGRTARITLLSLNGLTPRAHLTSAAPPLDLEGRISLQFEDSRGVSVLTLSREVRKLTRELLSQGFDWRHAIDVLRPYTPALWRAMPLQQRRRFLSHVRPFWEVQRHRMAPEIAARFESLVQSGQVEIIGGRVESASQVQGRLRVRCLLRKTRAIREMEFGWVVNCTGPLPSNRPESNPVIASLMVRGQLVPDALALGVQTSSQGRPIDSGGQEVQGLFVVGTLRKPECWESTAVPELRVQAAQVAGDVLREMGCGAHRRELA
jgi:uncharacterized NAD(P)/FAD-binding protein YdhS